MLRVTLPPVSPISKLICSHSAPPDAAWAPHWAGNGRVAHHWCGKSFGNGFVFGSFGQRPELTGAAADQADAWDDAMECIRRRVSRVLPSAGVEPITQRWASKRAFTPDSRPLIGRVQHPSLRVSRRLKGNGGVSGLFVVTGRGSGGFMQVVLAH